LIQLLGLPVEEFDLKEIIREVDLDQSGTVGFNEFVRIVYNMIRSQQQQETEGDGDEDGDPSKNNRGKATGFAKILNVGMKQGLLGELGDVMAKSKQKLSNWWNADLIAEEKRLATKREKKKKLEQAKRKRQQQDKDIYEIKQLEKQEIEKKRWQPIDGLTHEIEFQGDQVNFPNIGQYARMHYIGMFEDGTVFESTRKRGGAMEFRVGTGHIIKGFDIALQRMSVGETSKITVAPMLAYGVKGRPPRIPPNATLVFHIELISIKEKALPFDVQESYM
jgi:FK506-binding protein 1